MSEVQKLIDDTRRKLSKREISSKEELIVEELKKLNESITTKKNVQEVKILGMKEIKGEKGKDGKDGYTPIKGKDYFDGKNGKDGKDGRDGKNGKSIKGESGKDGKDGKNGKDGKDGSPDTAIEVRDKLSSLKGRSRLDAKHIKNLEKEIDLQITGISALSSATEGFEDPMTTRGDIIYKDSTNTTTRLPIGTNGQTILSDGTDISWGTPTGGGNVSTSGTPVDNDFAKFVNSTDIEGRSYSEVVSDLNLVIGTDVQAYDSQLDSLAGLVPGAEGRMITSDGLGNYQISSPGDVRSYLNVEDGAEVNVQSDWNEADSGDDAFILNKPDIPEDCSDIAIDTLGTPTWTTQCDFNKLFGSAGRTTGGAITDAGSETIDVSAGTGFIKATDSDTDTLLSFDWSANNGIAIPTDTVRYVKVSYNAGSPVVSVTATEDWDLDTSFPLGKVVNEGGVLHILNNPWWVTDGTTNIIERIQSEGNIIRDNRVGGLQLGVNASRQILVTAGQLWSRLTEFPISEFTAGSSFEVYWRSGASTWTDADLTVLPITQWNDLSTNTLETISNQKFFNWWIYVEADNNEVACVYPQGTYNTSAEAEAVSPPTSIPVHIRENGILIGRAIFKQGTATPILVQSAFTQVFSATQAADHGNLAGLSDDDHPQYVKDSEFTTDGGILVATGAGTFTEETGATLRSSIDVDQAGTDNSTDVTLAGTPDYITITGQEITRNAIDLTTDVTGELPTANVANTSGTNTGDQDIDDITPTTTKGDLLVENGSNVVRLPVGTNDYVLTADSGEATGVKWAAGGSGGGSTDGWNADSNTWTFSSADAPTFIVSVDADMTGVIGIGDRIKLTHGGSVKYFIVTVVGAFGGGVTLITLYGGTDYTLSATALTSPSYSHSKSPFGFPTAPSKWTVSLTDSTDRTQASPTANVWYNAGSLSINVPVGLWKWEWQALMASNSTAGQTGANIFVTLSTTNNSESDVEFTAISGVVGASATWTSFLSAAKCGTLSLATKDTYYVNFKSSNASTAQIALYNSTFYPLTVNFVCAYL